MHVAGQSKTTLFQFDQSGQSVSPIPFGYSKEGFENEMRDLVVGPHGEIHIYHGVFDAFLSTYDRRTGTWKERTFPGWTTANTATNGGIAAFGRYVFVSDTRLSEPDLRTGIIRFDMESDQAQRLETGDFNCYKLTMGWDNKLYALAPLGNDTVLRVYDPATLTLLRSLLIPTTLRALAVNRQGDLFAINGRTLSRYTASGTVAATFEAFPEIAPGTGIREQPWDLNVSSSGQLAVGTSSGKIVVLDQSLTQQRIITTRFLNSAFVAFDEPSL